VELCLRRKKKQKRSENVAQHVNNFHQDNRTNYHGVKRKGPVGGEA